LLQVHDIIAPQHGRTPVEETISDAKTGLHQRSPRLGAAYSVDPEPAQMLERLNGRPRAVPENAVSVDQWATMKNGRQPLLDIGNGCPLVPEGERQAYRYAAISWSS
jgi:hypothetical protein